MNNEEKNKEKLAENKLIILYLLNKADCSLTNIQMQKLLYDVEDFNYTDFFSPQEDYLEDLNHLEEAIETVQEKYSDNPDIQKAIREIVELKKELSSQ